MHGRVASPKRKRPTVACATAPPWAGLRSARSAISEEHSSRTCLVGFWGRLHLATRVGRWRHIARARVTRPHLAPIWGRLAHACVLLRRRRQRPLLVAPLADLLDPDDGHDHRAAL